VQTGLGVVLSGPSGVGKNTVLEHLCRLRPAMHVMVSWTTRERRADEVDGVDYHFVERDGFAQAIQSHGFAEWAEVHDEWYGTPRADLQERLARGEEVALILDVQGAMSVRALPLPLKLVFLFPPSLPELERRLNGRGSEDLERRRKRLERAQGEMAMAEAYDAVVINADAAGAAERISDQMDQWHEQPETESHLREYPGEVIVFGAAEAVLMDTGDEQERALG